MDISIFFNYSTMRATSLDTEQGRVEQRTERYLSYCEGVAETLTPQCTKSSAELLARPAGRPKTSGGLQWR